MSLDTPHHHVDEDRLSRRLIALLFTDLKGSTAIYERIGDMKAFDLVKQHFGYLRESISGNSGALAKTIGDAVMASFVDPLRSALDMRTRIAEFNATAGSDLIGLKISLHAGACLAVTLNERLDYFGQTVNIAARVQALSEAARSPSRKTSGRSRGSRICCGVPRSSHRMSNSRGSKGRSTCTASATSPHTRNQPARRGYSGVDLRGGNMTESTKDAWAEVGKRFASWGHQVTERYRQAGSSQASPEAQGELQRGARQVVGDAITATVDEARRAIRSGGSGS